MFLSWPKDEVFGIRNACLTDIIILPIFQQLIFASPLQSKELARLGAANAQPPGPPASIATTVILRAPRKLPVNFVGVTMQCC